MEFCLKEKFQEQLETTLQEMRSESFVEIKQKIMSLIAISPGDPAGIGPEVCLRALKT